MTGGTRMQDDGLGRLVSLLPHRPPFRFVTDVLAIDESPAHSTIDGMWGIRGDESFFLGHFPGRPIVPGVLLGEALAQLAGILWHVVDARRRGVSLDLPGRAELVLIDVKFRRPVLPPAAVLLRATLGTALNGMAMFDAKAIVDGATVAEGRVALHGGPVEGDTDRLP